MTILSELGCRIAVIQMSSCFNQIRNRKGYEESKANKHNSRMMVVRIAVLGLKAFG